MTDQPSTNNGTLSLALGASSFCCTIFTGIPAIALGVMAIQSGDPTQKQRGVIGISLASLTTLLLCIGAVAPRPGLDPAPRAPVASSSPAITTEPSVPMPEAEKAFCAAIARAKAAYSGGGNDLQKSRIAKERAISLKAAVPGGKIENWVGSIDTLTTNGDGKAILVVQLPCESTVGTWNNAMSDIMDNTLIPQSSGVFATLESAESGMNLSFSATLVPDEDKGFREASLTEAGSVTAPFWIAKIQAVRLTK